MSFHSGSSCRILVAMEDAAAPATAPEPSRPAPDTRVAQVGGILTIACGLYWTIRPWIGVREFEPALLALTGCALLVAVLGVLALLRRSAACGAGALAGLVVGLIAFTGTFSPLSIVFGIAQLVAAVLLTVGAGKVQAYEIWRERTSPEEGRRKKLRIPEQRPSLLLPRIAGATVVGWSGYWLVEMAAVSTGIGWADALLLYAPVTLTAALGVLAALGRYGACVGATLLLGLLVTPMLFAMSLGAKVIVPFVIQVTAIPLLVVAAYQAQRFELWQAAKRSGRA